jgi:hypothetical protein
VSRGHAPVGGAEGFGSVFQNGHAVGPAYCQNGIHIGALAIKMNHNEGAGQFISPCALTEGIFEDVRVHGPTGVIAVQEHRLCTEIADWIAARGKRERGAKDFVARSDTEEAQAEVNSSGTAGKRYARQPDAVLEGLFKGG